MIFNVNKLGLQGLILVSKVSAVDASELVAIESLSLSRNSVAQCAQRRTQVYMLPQL